MVVKSGDSRTIHATESDDDGKTADSSVRTDLRVFSFLNIPSRARDTRRHAEETSPKGKKNYSQGGRTGYVLRSAEGLPRHVARLLGRRVFCSRRRPELIRAPSNPRRLPTTQTSGIFRPEPPPWGLARAPCRAAAAILLPPHRLTCLSNVIIDGRRKILRVRPRRMCRPW